jgi:hypothetical protein
MAQPICIAGNLVSVVSLTGWVTVVTNTVGRVNGLSEEVADEIPTYVSKEADELSSAVMTVL